MQPHSQIPSNKNQYWLDLKKTLLVWGKKKHFLNKCDQEQLQMFADTCIFVEFQNL